jgi:hypothetical protein
MLGGMSDDLARYLRQNPSHLPLNRQALDTAPEYLRSTVSMTHSAFPDGLPLEDYFSLLYLFREQGFSDRGIAKAVQTCFDKEYADALHDVYRSDDPAPPLDKVERLRRHLLSHGFEAWEKEQHDAIS